LEVQLVRMTALMGIGCPSPTLMLNSGTNGLDGCPSPTLMLNYGTNGLDGCPSPTLMLNYGTNGLDGFTAVRGGWRVFEGAGECSRGLARFSPGQ
jgi:hypothetical protein